MSYLPICKSQYTFELLTEDGYGTGVFITVISSRSESVTQDIKNHLLYIKRAQEIQSELNDSIESTLDLVNEELSLEVKSAVSRIVGWQGFEDTFNLENAYLLCSTNPFIRKQIIYHSDRIGLFLDECVEQLIAYAKNELKLSEKQKDGGTLRDHLTNVRDRTGFTPPELTTVEVSNLVIYLWEFFLDLNSTRQSGMGVNAISYQEIKAWCELTKTPLSAYEIKVIKMLDRTFLEHYNKQSEKDSK